MKKLKGIIYSRVSTQQQDYERQIEELNVFAINENIEIISTPFCDKISGSVKGTERKGWNDMLLFIEKNSVDIVLVWEISRIGRNMIDSLDSINFLSNKKINIYFKKEMLYSLNDELLRDSRTSFILNIMTSCAENEKETIKERMQSGQISKVAQGGAGYGILKPYGYKSVDKKLVVDDDECEIVKQIFQKYLEGYGTKQIANWLNQQKIPTKYNKVYEANKVIKSKKGYKKEAKNYRWVDGTIYSILKNRIYTGIRTFKGHEYKISPIIENTIFDRVQERLHSQYNKKDTKRIFDNILKDRIKCGVCGKGYYMHKRITKKDNAYKCITTREYSYNERVNVCDNIGIGIDRLNNAIFYHFKTSKELENSIKSRVNNETIIKEKEKLTTTLELEESTLTSLECEKDRFINIYTKGIIDEQDFEKNFDRITQEKLKIQRKIKKYKKDIDSMKNILEKQINIENSLWEIQENPSLFKSHIHFIIDKIEVVGIKNMGLLNKIFTNKQDIAVLIKISLYNGFIVEFVISQRSNKIVYLVDDVIKNRSYCGNGDESFFEYKFDIKV